MPCPQARHRGAPDEARMSAITIRQLVPGDIRSGARLLAASMQDNPLHQAVFGGVGRRVEDLAARAFERLMPRLMARGQVHLLPPQDKGMIDRAWNALVAGLRKFSGTNLTTETAT